MHWLLLLGFIALAAVARAEEEVLHEEEQLNLLDSVHEDSRIPFARLLGDLFEFDDEADAEHDEELGINREARAKGEESAVEQKAVVEPEDLARYNKFMDTFFRRLNADARNTIDPLEVGLVTKKKKAAKKGAKKKGKQVDDKEGRRKTPKNKKKNQKKGGNKNQKNKKNKQNKNKKKTGRHPKSLAVVEVEDDSDDEVVVAGEEVHHLVTRDAKLIEEIEEDDDEEEALERQERSADLVDDKELEDTDVAVSRSGKPKANKKPNSNNKSKGQKKKRKGTKKGGNKNKGNKGKRSTNNNNKKSKGKSGPKTSRASVSGIASLTRIGDVSVVNRKDGKELRTEFKIGPVKLKVNRRFGSGKSAIVRSATAESPELTGKMHLLVAANGKAKITKFNILRPSVVTTSGNLNKDGARLDNNNFMEKSIGRIVPNAAKKLKLAARDVLQATESKN